MPPLAYKNNYIQFNSTTNSRIKLDSHTLKEYPIPSIYSTQTLDPKPQINPKLEPINFEALEEELD